MIDAFAAVGAGLVKALAAVRSGLILGAGALLFTSIATANESQVVVDPLKTIFAVIAMTIGSVALLVVLIYLIDQGKRVLENFKS